MPLAFWRGSTTGSKDIDLNTLELNRRYQLARLSRAWPHRLDARINQTVQCRDAKAREQVEHRLQQEGLLSATVNPWHAALHAWQIDIDGNVNSWGLLWKLLSGSCILRVESPRRQWYHPRLQPWVHLVPVNADLSDLGEKLTWCSNHRQECAAIAAAGKALAENVVQEIEDDLVECRGALRAGMDVSSAWSAHEWMNRGSELLDPDPWLAKRLLARGLQIEPSESIAWFNLGNRPAPTAPHCCSRTRLSPLPDPSPQQGNRAGSTQQPGSGFALAGPLAGGLGALRPAFWPQTGKPSLLRTCLWP